MAIAVVLFGQIGAISALPRAVAPQAVSSRKTKQIVVRVRPRVVADSNVAVAPRTAKTGSQQSSRVGVVVVVRVSPPGLTGGGVVRVARRIAVVVGRYGSARLHRAQRRLLAQRRVGRPLRRQHKVVREPVKHSTQRAAPEEKPHGFAELGRRATPPSAVLIENRPERRLRERLLTDVNP